MKLNMNKFGCEVNTNTVAGDIFAVIDNNGFNELQAIQIHLKELKGEIDTFIELSPNFTENEFFDLLKTLNLNSWEYSVKGTIWINEHVWATRIQNLSPLDRNPDRWVILQQPIFGEGGTVRHLNQINYVTDYITY